MKIRFLADENLRRAIVLGVRRREPSVDFRHAFEVGAAGKDDLTLLRIAAEEGRLLVSHDLKTMPQNFRHFAAGQASPGVIMISQKLTPSTAIEELVTIWLACEVEEWVNQIRYLPLDDLRTCVPGRVLVTFKNAQTACVTSGKPGDRRDGFRPGNCNGMATALLEHFSS